MTITGVVDPTIIDPSAVIPNEGAFVFGYQRGSLALSRTTAPTDSRE